MTHERTNKEIIVDALLSANQLYNASGSKEEADLRYKVLTDVLRRYHIIVWGKK